MLQLEKNPQNSFFEAFVPFFLGYLYTPVFSPLQTLIHLNIRRRKRLNRRTPPPRPRLRVRTPSPRRSWRTWSPRPAGTRGWGITSPWDLATDINSPQHMVSISLFVELARPFFFINTKRYTNKKKLLCNLKNYKLGDKNCPRQLS